MPSSRIDHLNPRRSRKARPGRVVAIINLAGIVAFLLPLVAATPPFLDAIEAGRRSELASAALGVAGDHRSLIIEYRGLTEDALRFVEAGEMDAVEPLASQLIELGGRLRAGAVEVEASARRSGEAELAQAFAQASDAVAAAADESLTVYGTPGVDTSPQREAARAVTSELDEILGELIDDHQQEVDEATSKAQSAMGDVRRNALAATVVAGIMMSAITIAFRRRLIIDERDHLAIQAIRDEEKARTDFEMRLRGGLDMASTESDAHDAVARGLTAISTDLPAELMLADSSRTHFEVVAANQVAGCDGCSVRSPSDCPAVRHGHALTFESSEALDACPFLRGRAQGPMSAVCIPMSIGSQTSGVLHIATPHEQLPDDAEVELYETVARVSSDRLGMLRAMARSEAQAATDPLTGLLNRRSLDDQARELMAGEVPFTVAFGDLDHFKQLNDMHGHETGDRALRMFSRILSVETRPGDVVVRFGGEEFVVLLPRANADDTLEVLARVRQRMVDHIPTANLPHFTVSFGVCEWDGLSDLRTVIACADRALLQAKADGRNRDVVADPCADAGEPPAARDPLAAGS